MPNELEHDVVIKTVLLNLSNQIEQLGILNTEYQKKMILFKANQSPDGTGRQLERLSSKIQALERSKAITMDAYKASIEQSIDDKEPMAKESRCLACAKGMLVLAKKQLDLAEASSNVATKARRYNMNDPIKTATWQSCMLQRVDAAEGLRQAKIQLTAAEKALELKQNASSHNAISHTTHARQQMDRLRDSQNNDSQESLSSSIRRGME